MGREVRMVIPNWEHPKKDGVYIPMYDNSFDEDFFEWVENYKLWKKGKHPDQLDTEFDTNMQFWEWDGGPPDPENYRPDWKNEEMTWYQMYETVSEGTPVSPAFATKEELIEYLVNNGDYWDQLRGDGGWSRENATNFVNRGFAFSGILNTSTGEYKMARDGA